MDEDHSPAEPVFKRGLGQRSFQLMRVSPQVLDLIRSGYACRVNGKPTLTLGLVFGPIW